MRTHYNDLAESTQEKSEYLDWNYTRVWDHQLDDIARNAKPETAQVFLYLLVLLRQSKGYLREENLDISRKMGVTKGVVSAAIKELKKLKVLKETEESGTFHPFLAAYYRRTSKRNKKSSHYGTGLEGEAEQNLYHSISNSVEVEGVERSETTTDTDTNLPTDKKGMAGASPLLPHAASADGRALLKDCWNIPNVNIAPEVTVGFVAGLSTQLGVADAATSFRKLCASHAKSGKTLGVWNVESWFNNEGKRKASSKPQHTTAEVKAPSVPAQDEPYEIVIDL
jgi:hypothetical protein